MGTYFGGTSGFSLGWVQALVSDLIFPFQLQLLILEKVCELENISVDRVTSHLDGRMVSCVKHTPLILFSLDGMIRIIQPENDSLIHADQ